jgi:hypothetical protein
MGVFAALCISLHEGYYYHYDGARGFRFQGAGETTDDSRLADRPCRIPIFCRLAFGSSEPARLLPSTKHCILSMRWFVLSWIVSESHLPACVQFKARAYYAYELSPLWVLTSQSQFAMGQMFTWLCALNPAAHAWC